jgi:hypothetical protein
MIKRIFIVTLLLFNSQAYSADRSIQDIVKSEYGDCYSTFKQNISYCRPSSCTYPDFSDAKAWKTHIIRGKIDNKCYVIYYSYLGKNIIGTPEHCFYSRENLDKLSSLYSALFSTSSAFEMADAKDQINQLHRNVCKTDAQQK